MYVEEKFAYIVNPLHATKVTRLTRLFRFHEPSIYSMFAFVSLFKEAVNSSGYAESKDRIKK